MQTVSNNLLNLLRSKSTDLVGVVEFYKPDAVPGANGLDPASTDFLKGYSNVSGITFRSRSYEKKVTRFNNLVKTLTKTINNASVTLSNQDRQIAAFYFEQGGFEGLIMQIRLISLSVSAALSDSIVGFVGRCEKPNEFSRSAETVSISAKHLIGSIEAEIPRRKFRYEDPNGRTFDDKLFEGFRYMPIYGTIAYAVRERRGGLLGFLGFKKTVWKSLPYSSHSDLDIQKVVPVILGRFQASGIHVGYVDIGTVIDTTTVFCEGPISGFLNPRSSNAHFPLRLDLANQQNHGYLGGDITSDPTHQQVPASPPNRVANGYYSRSAVFFTAFSGSQLQVDDPAPELVAIVLGMQVYQPDAGGVFTIRAWSDNPVYNTRFILESEDYLKLGAGWLDDEINKTEGGYAGEILLDQAGTDFVFLPDTETFAAGAEYKLFQSTGIVTPEYLKLLGGTLIGDQLAPFKKEVKYNFFNDQNAIPIEPPDNEPVPQPGNTFGTRYRRRYTCNVAITEQQKAIDFLYDVMLPGFRGYLTQNALGKIGIKIKKPVPFSFLRASTAIGANSITVKDVDFWFGKTGLKILTGANLETSELRTIISAQYSPDGNAITLTAAGGVTASSATLSSGTVSLPASATLTVTTNTGTKTVTIGGTLLQYLSASADTIQTVAGFLAAAINSNPVLQKFVKAEWTPNTAVVTVKSKFGAITFDAPFEFVHLTEIASPTAAPVLSAIAGSLEAGIYYVCYSYQNNKGETATSPLASITLTANQAISVAAVAVPAGAGLINWYCSVAKDSFRRRRIAQTTGAGFSITVLPTLDKEMLPDFNSTGEEILAIQMSFADKTSAQSGASRSNVFKGSLKFPLGTRQKSINRIDLKYRDTAQDWRLTELQISDKPHQKKVGKILNQEINGSAIDNYHQAYRIATGLVAENRDADFFYGFEADGEALLLEEGDVVCVSDEQGGIVNLPLRIEDINLEIGEYPSVKIIARRYFTTLYDDRVAERNVPVATTLNRFSENKTYFDRYGALRSESGIVPVITDSNVNLGGAATFEIKGSNAAGEIIFTPSAATTDQYILRVAFPAIEAGFKPIILLTASGEPAANQKFYAKSFDGYAEIYSASAKIAGEEYRIFYHVFMAKTSSLNIFKPTGSQTDNITAGNNTATVARGASVLINVLANDTDGNAGTLSILKTDKPTHGTAKIEAGQIRFYADNYFVGKVSFYYTAKSSAGDFKVKGLVIVNVT